MRKRNMTLVTAIAAAVAFAPTAQAAVIASGVTQTLGVSPAAANEFISENGGGTDITDGTFNGTSSVTLTSLWTHNGGRLKFGHSTTATVTISGGGVLNVTETVTDTFALQFGNKAGGVVTAMITGAGSKAMTLSNINVGRKADGSTLTLELGGMAVATGVVLGRQEGDNNFIRMGLGGILAISGTGKTTTSEFWSTGIGTGNLMQYWDGSAWDDITNATGADYTIANGTDELTGYSVLTMTIPEPSSMSLLALGGLALLRRRRA